MRHISLPVAIFLGCTLLAAPARAQGKATLADRVHNSINKGERYLLSQQWPEGDWEKAEGYANHVGGITALATLALLNAGVPDADRPRVEKALSYLRGLEVNSVYARALQTMALTEASLDPRRDEVSRKKDLEVIRRNVQWLINARVVNDGRLQGWAYNNVNKGSKNASTSQYALLGLWAGKQAGIEIKRDLWEAIRDYYVRTQDPQAGFWIYDPQFGPRGHDQPSITMTTAGLAGLLIAGMELNS